MTHSRNMIKTSDKNRLFIIKIINLKVFNDMIATNVASDFIIFVDLSIAH